VQSGVPQEGRRTRTVGAFGELPEERQYRLYRRPRAEVGSGNAPHPELRPRVAERDQGSAGPDGAAPRHGSAGLAARKYRRAGQALRGSLLRSVIPGRAVARTSDVRLHVGESRSCYIEIPDRRFTASGMTGVQAGETPCVTARFIARSIAPPNIGAR